jgi:hypothetical protein
LADLFCERTHGRIAAAVRSCRATPTALSRCRTENAKILRLAYFQAIVTAARQVLIADARKSRYVDADVRWRWALKMLEMMAWVKRNRWAEPGLLKPCTLRSLRRVG